MNKLIEKFQEVDLQELEKYKDVLYTTLENGEIPKPYIPRIGENYDSSKIIFYGKAQNKPDQKYFAKNWVTHLTEDLWIAPAEIMLALVGMYLYGQTDKKTENIWEILENIAISNYYKFSLHKNGKDLNPDDDDFINNYDIKDYYKLNDELVKYELDYLKPNIIFTFQGRQVNNLNKIIKEIGLDNSRIIPVNDPAWIFQFSGGGKLKVNGDWDKEMNDEKAQNLINKYIEQITNKRYKSRADSVNIYLKKYFLDWKKI